MSSRKRQIPKHCLHKASNRGVVRLNGRDHYTAGWGTPEAEAGYHRLVAEWLANHQLPVSGASADNSANPKTEITVEDLIHVFWRHVESYYRRADGSPTSEPVNYRYALRPLRKLYGTLPVELYSPLKLKAVREVMIDAGLARGVINSRIARIVRMFRWAVAEELVPETVHRALAALPPLKKGRSADRESWKIGCVAEQDVVAVLPFLSGQVRAMVELQRLTGMRSAEVCDMRGACLDTSGAIWEYRPSTHKSAHHEKERVVFLGPRVQELIRPRLKSDPEAFLFSPNEALEERRLKLRALRKTIVQPSQRNRRRPAPKRKPGKKYTAQSYGRAVLRACRRAGVPHWHPHQLRHTRGTEVRKVYNLEGAQVALGHSHAKITEVYAERDHALA